MTSPNPNIFSEDFDLDVKPIQTSLMEKFRSYLGQNITASNDGLDNLLIPDLASPNENSCNISSKPNKSKESGQRIKKYKKGIFDSDITLAEMLDKKPKFSKKHIEKKPKNKKVNKEIKESEPPKKEIYTHRDESDNRNDKECYKMSILNSDSNGNDKITSLSFKKGLNSKVSKWNEEDTIKFYNGIQRYGTDFSLISTLFTNKTRIQIKNKYQRELKQNPLKIDKNLKNPKQISKNSGGKLIELDNRIKKSHEKRSNILDFTENSGNSKDIPEINLDDLNILKNNSLISHDSLDKNINEQIFKIIQNETDCLKREKNFQAFI